MKKYVETKSKAPFDWNKALSKNCKEMPQGELKNLGRLAKSWVTCACGNQCAVIPRERKSDGISEVGQPLDDKLRILGSEFYNLGVGEMVSQLENYHTTDSEGIWADAKVQYLRDANKARLKAIGILKKIEKRSAALIKIETDKAKKILSHLGYTIKK